VACNSRAVWVAVAAWGGDCRLGKGWGGIIHGIRLGEIQ